MAADGAAAEVPTPAVFAQRGGASRPGAGWVYVELHATSWKCNFCAKSFAGSNHTRVRAGAPRTVRQVHRNIQHTSQQCALYLGCLGLGAPLRQRQGHLVVPQCHAGCQGGDGTGPARRNRQKGRRAWSNGHARRMAMVVLSKSTGAGAPERNWADVKVVYGRINLEPYFF